MSTLELREIARREEGRQARALAEAAEFALPIAGGTVGRGVPGLWHNYAVGLGLAGPVADADLDAAIAFHADHGVEPRIELCPFAHDSLLAGLAKRGFVLRLFEMTFFRALDPECPVQPVFTPPADLRVEIVNAADPAAVREFARTAIAGFLPPEQAITDDMIESASRNVRHPRSVAVVGRLDGQTIAAGAMEVAGESCALFGLSVAPAFRRRGIQQAMLAWRLNHAASRGCRFACIGGKPGEGTERNVRRMGFTLAYTKVHLVKPGPGLTPMQG
ncbi:MAG: GNAT family acetyltransferase [Phycisphaerae bacterium]|nr:MAG: GNAT family acetyltransferase [Phycisphaerae bacterium]